MESLPIVRAILAAAAGVTAARSGGIRTNTAREKDPLPNVVIMAVGGSEGMSHQGPSGLLSERVRIWARAATADQAGTLGVAIDRALNGYTGNVSGASVQLVEKVSTMSDYEANALVQRMILDFRVHWRRAP